MRAAAAAIVLLSAACGYHFSQRYVAAGGADRIHVHAFRNLSTEPELGAVVTAALRSELARRGSEAPEGAAAALDGEVHATEPVIAALVAPNVATTWRIAIEIRARLASPGRAPLQRTVRRDIDYLSGVDPLETEGRRALALRRAADDSARDLLRSFER
jgi:outer membrane lipopolysaccharide assembly protein LptE/RlpB